MTTINVKFTNKNSKMPSYANPTDTGADLYSTDEKIILPGEVALIGTGLILEPEEIVDVQIRSRSGMALKHSVIVLNSPGTIDSSYRNEVKVILINLGKKPYHVNIGDRVAQMVVSSFVSARFNQVDEVSETDRNLGGFGSTGV